MKTGNVWSTHLQMWKILFMDLRITFQQLLRIPRKTYNMGLKKQIAPGYQFCWYQKHSQGKSAVTLQPLP